MRVDAINLLTEPSADYLSVLKANPEDIKQPFEYFFDSFSGLVKDTNAYQLSADKMQLDFASGRSDDILAVMLAQEKAYAALSFTVQVTNKVVEAYKEVMRLSI